MNITSWDIYWITRLDAIKSFMPILIIFLVVTIGGFFISFLGEASTQRTEAEAVPYVRSMKVCGYLFFVPIFLATVYPFIPTTKEACMMYAVPKLVDSECVKTLQGDAKELYTLGIEKLKAELAVKGGKDDFK